MAKVNQTERTNKIKSGVITTVITGVLGVFMLIVGFKPPDPPMTEGEGLLVDFGTDLTGLGELEPDAPMGGNVPVSSPDDNPAITQNTEQTISLPEKKNTTKPNTTSTTSTTTTNTINKDDLFDPGKINNKGQNGTNSEGNSTYGGNQGTANGDTNGSYGPGSGVGTGGYGLDLVGRSMTVKPSLSLEHSETGDVRIKIYVDRNGKVTKAEYERSGSTITDNYLITQAKNAALKTHYNVKADAPEIQVGYLTFHFKLQ